MVFFAVLASFVIEPFDVTVMTCDADWLERGPFEKMVRAEIIELKETQRSGMILTVDRCTNASVRLRVSGEQGQRARIVEIGDVPKEARLRTIVLALGELAKELRDSSIEETALHSDAAVLPVGRSKSREATSSTHVGHQQENKSQFGPMTPPKENGAAEDPEVTKETEGDAAEKDSGQPKSAPVQPHSHRRTGEQWENDDDAVEFGAYLRGFPQVETIAPEGRIGLRIERWRFDFRGYGMGWTNDLGDVYLLAFSLTAGHAIWHYHGKVHAGLDALAELGAVNAFGKANEDVKHTPKFNMLSGLHFALWVSPGSRRVKPTFTLELGWVRGLNVFAGEDHQGGFEGVSASVGIGGVI